MNTAFRFLLLITACLIWSCDEPTTTNKPNPAPSTTDTPTAQPATGTETGTTEIPDPPKGMSMPVPTKHDCKIEGMTLDDNQLWLQQDQTLVGIIADESTKSIDFGDSYRIFVAMDTRDCKTLLRETLPVNMSPDFPYYLNANTYEPINKVICTQGYEAVFCYDAVAKKLLPAMTPQFLTERSAEDAQSGMPAGLEIWRHFLIGNTLDFGAYVFDISEKSKPKAVMPVAEYESPEDASYISLFLLETKTGLHQAFIPTLNEDQDGTEVKRLFKKPLQVNTTIKKSARDNRFIVLKHKKGAASSAIDMQEMKEVELPDDVAAKGAQDILAWLKKQ